METICRLEGHWCSECCEGRNCKDFGQLSDGTWGCTTHPNKPQLCKDVNCLAEMGIPIDVAVEKVKALPKGEFVASNLGEKLYASIGLTD